MSVDDDYQVVNWQGDIIRDTAAERHEQERHRVRREGEPFTASTDCPWCGHLAVHWLDQPRRWDNGTSPAAQAARMINESIATMASILGPPRTPYDGPLTAVARICVKCGYRWGQS